MLVQLGQQKVMGAYSWEGAGRQWPLGRGQQTVTHTPNPVQIQYCPLYLYSPCAKTIFKWLKNK